MFSTKSQLKSSHSYSLIILCSTKERIVLKVEYSLIVTVSPIKISLCFALVTATVIRRLSSKISC